MLFEGMKIEELIKEILHRLPLHIMIVFILCFEGIKKRGKGIEWEWIENKI